MKGKIVIYHIHRLLSKCLTFPDVVGFHISYYPDWLLCRCELSRLILSNVIRRESLIAVRGKLCMPTFIGSMCRNEWSSSSCRRCITAFNTRLPGTWRTTAFRPPMWPVDDIFILPGVITTLCLDTVSTRMGVGHWLLPAQVPGTHWAMICVIRRLALTVSDVCLKLGFFQSTSVHTAH